MEVQRKRLWISVSGVSIVMLRVAIVYEFTMESNGETGSGVEENARLRVDADSSVCVGVG